MIAFTYLWFFESGLNLAQEYVVKNLILSVKKPEVFDLSSAIIKHTRVIILLSYNNNSIDIY